jgi:SAM-dependent methyltransferase
MDAEGEPLTSYYEARAPEYDETTYELARADPAAARDLSTLEQFVAELPAVSVLDVGCGTGWLTQHLRGVVVALDASEAMLRLASARVPDATFVRATVPPLPFPSGSFERVFASHVYSHLDTEAERRGFVTEALRVGHELVVVEQAWRPGLPREAWEERVLRGGEAHRVFKRYLAAPALADELGGSVALDTPTFLAVRTSQPVNRPAERQRETAVCPEVTRSRRRGGAP